LLEERNKRMRILATICLALLTLSLPLRAETNPYGTHTLYQDALSDENIDRAVNWTRHLCGEWGTLKTMIYPITPETRGAQESWKKLIRRAYEAQLIPVLRMDEPLGNKSPDTPDGTYGDIAEAYAAVVRDLLAENPTEMPLYFEIRNEPNNANEWSNAPNPGEYGRFFVAVARAIHALGDPRAKVVNGALSPGGSYDNLRFARKLAKVDGFVENLDAWATHAYPGNTPPWINMHDGTAESHIGVIDGYVAELVELATGGVDVSNLPVLITEFAYSTGAAGGDYPPLDEGLRTEYVVRAFRDYWTRWPEVVSVNPYYLQGPFDRVTQPWVWIEAGTGSTEEGLPAGALPHYEAVAQLWKPGDTKGCFSGNVRDLFGNPLEGAVVRLAELDRSVETNSAGFFIMGDVAPGIYSAEVSAGNGISPAEVGAGRYETRIEPFFMAEPENRVMDFSLEPLFDAGSVAGTVRNQLTDEPVPNTFVEVLPGRITGRTDRSGRFLAEGIVPGTYSLRIQKSGFDVVRLSEIEVKAGKTGEYDLKLSPNRLTNGGLEPLEDHVGQTASHWAAGTWKDGGQLRDPRYSVDGTIFRSGVASQRIEAQAGATDHVWQFSGYSAVEPGNILDAGVYIQTQNLARGEKGKGARMVLTFYTNDMEELDSFSSEALTGSNDWTLVTVEARVPPRAGRVETSLDVSADEGSVWFDDAYLRDRSGEDDPGNREVE